MLKQLETWLVAANRWVLITLLIVMACVVFVNVILRYTTGDSLIWGEEVARHLMIWCTFLGAGLVFRFGGHVAIENLHQAVGSRLAQAVRCVVAIAIAAFCAVMGYFSIEYLMVMRYQTTPSTGISFAYVYAALPVGFGLLLVHLLLVVRRYVTSGAFVESAEMDADAAASL